MLKLGGIVAWLALIMGVLRAAIGSFVASIDDPASRAAAASRYLGSATSGEAIDQGIKVFLFGLVLGILVKIARSLSEKKE
ncbi:hypothetical protein [Tabrizicola sp.]|uniref:hypothetical protein n=1 Tax=Tabrizicola sp. TaxID=2005166 RepID=UPI002FDDF1A0